MKKFSEFIAEKRSDKERYASISKKLEGHLGKDSFNRNAERIMKHLKVKHATGVSKEFTGRADRSKRKGLGSMWVRNNNLLTFRAQSAHNKGRTAA